MAPTQHYPVWYVAVCGTVFAVEGVVGFLFNLIVLVVYHLNKRTLKSVSNVLITNLNIIDMLISLVCCPVSLAYTATSRFHGQGLCYVFEASVAFASTASAVNLLFISFDRYESIVVPMKRKIKDTNVKYVVASVWVLATVAVLLPIFGYIEAAVGSVISEAENLNSSVPCSFWLHGSKAFYVHEMYYIAVFLISSVVTMICYYKVFRLAKQRLALRIALLRSTMTLPGSKPLMDLKKQQDKRVTTMTLVIVCTFIICWGPNMTITVSGLFMESNLYFEMIQTGLLCLAYLTTVLHPLLYAFLRENFREALRDKWRSRPQVRNAKISPNPSSSTNNVRLLAVRQIDDPSLSDFPTISQLVSPVNNVSVSLQDALVFSPR
ncbi:G-protein coupled receptor 22-like [Liolophura sinensis]|uniref:G-protein coupled receptor 22-like n=1 Tax=Liolophura sinensis TaxID=3198878 RepID=UPI0031582C77